MTDEHTAGHYGNKCPLGYSAHGYQLHGYDNTLSNQGYTLEGSRNEYTSTSSNHGHQFGSHDCECYLGYQSIHHGYLTEFHTSGFPSQKCHLASVKHGNLPGNQHHHGYRFKYGYHNPPYKNGFHSILPVSNLKLKIPTWIFFSLNLVSTFRRLRHQGFSLLFVFILLFDLLIPPPLAGAAHAFKSDVTDMQGSMENTQSNYTPNDVIFTYHKSGDVMLNLHTNSNLVINKHDPASRIHTQDSNPKNYKPRRIKIKSAALKMDTDPTNYTSTANICPNKQTAAFWDIIASSSPAHLRNLSSDQCLYCDHNANFQENSAKCAQHNTSAENITSIICDQLHSSRSTPKSALNAAHADKHKVHLHSTGRTRAMHNLTLHFCDNYPISATLDRCNPLCANLDTSDNVTCRGCLDPIIDLDRQAEVMYSYFLDIMTSYDCGKDYAYKSTCKDCVVAYKMWICSRLIPLYDESQLIPPCDDYCRRVEQTCPYLLPRVDTQYMGQPAFLCTVDEIPIQEVDLLLSFPRCYTNYGCEQPNHGLLPSRLICIRNMTQTPPVKLKDNTQSERAEVEEKLHSAFENQNQTIDKDKNIVENDEQSYMKHNQIAYNGGRDGHHHVSKEILKSETNSLDSHIKKYPPSERVKIPQNISPSVTSKDTDDVRHNKQNDVEDVTKMGSHISANVAPNSQVQANSLFIFLVCICSIFTMYS